VNGEDIGGGSCGIILLSIVKKIAETLC